MYVSSQIGAPPTIPDGTVTGKSPRNVSTGIVRGAQTAIAEKH
jgi:hypothetical protein